MTRDIKARIEQKLIQAFAPEILSVIDESHLHAGHAAARPEGESHFRVHICASAFTGKLPVEQHRMVHGALGEIMKEIHALSLRITSCAREVGY